MNTHHMNTTYPTHPVIFGIGTVECIVSSDKTELVGCHMLLFQTSPKTAPRCCLASGKKAWRRRDGGKKRRLFKKQASAGLVLGAVKERQPKRRRERRASSIQARKEGWVSARLSDLQECGICGRPSLRFLAACLWPAVCLSFSSIPLSLHRAHFLWILPQCKLKRTTCLLIQSNIFL